MRMDGSQGEFEFGANPLAPSAVRRFLADNPDFLEGDEGLLAELGLTVAAGNVVEFAPMARVHAAHQREAEQRQILEETARANFAAQAQTHGAVVDLLYVNVVGAPPPPAQREHYVNLLAQGTATQAALALFAAGTALNLENIDFVELVAQGWPYQP